MQENPKATAEHYFKNDYSKFSERLHLIETKLFEHFCSFDRNLIDNNDFRPHTFGRMLNSCASVHFLLDRTKGFIESEANWEAVYIETYFPFAKFHDPVRLFYEVDFAMRFSLFHSVYHNLETTIRIIARLLLNDNKRMFERINQQLLIFPDGYIEFISAVRNTIHNNGYYQPIRHQPKSFAYTITGKIYVFKEHEMIRMGTDDVLLIVDSIIDLTYKLLTHPQVIGLPLTDDKN